MSIKDQIKSGVKSSINTFLEGVVQEASPMVSRFTQVRSMENFRIKFLIKGTSRIVYVQTDRREFIKAEFAGRRMTEVTRFNSLPEIEEDTRSVMGDSYRLVNDQDAAMNSVRSALSGLMRRSASFSPEETIVVAMLTYINQSVVTDVEDEDEEGEFEYSPVGQYELQTVGRGWMVVRPVS